MTNVLELKGPMMMPVIVATHDANSVITVPAMEKAFYEFLGTPLQKVRRGSFTYIVPARLIERLDEALAKPGLKAEYYLPDVAVRQIQPRVSPELAGIYEAFGIKTENVAYYGNDCTVLTSSIMDLLESKVITSESADQVDFARRPPADAVYVSIDKIFLKKVYLVELPRIVKFLTPLFSATYLHIVDASSDVYVHPGRGDDISALIATLNV